MSIGRQRVGAFSKRLHVEKLPLNIRIQWNAGTACMSECMLKTLVCRGLRVGPSKFRARHRGWRIIHLKTQLANGGAWIGGVWIGQISGPEIYFSRPDLSGPDCFAG